MENQSNWNRISEDSSELTKKIKDKILNENDDIKESLKSTISSTTESLKKLVENIEDTIKDPEIKSESLELIKNISTELKIFINKNTQFFGIEEE